MVNGDNVVIMVFIPSDHTLFLKKIAVQTYCRNEKMISSFLFSPFKICLVLKAYP